MTFFKVWQEQLDKGKEIMQSKEIHGKFSSSYRFVLMILENSFLKTRNNFIFPKAEPNVTRAARI